MFESSVQHFGNFVFVKCAIEIKWIEFIFIGTALYSRKSPNMVYLLLFMSVLHSSC